MEWPQRKNGTRGRRRRRMKEEDARLSGAWPAVKGPDDDASAVAEK